MIGSSDQDDAARLDDRVALRPGPVAPDTPAEAGLIAALTDGEAVGALLPRLPIERVAAQALIRRMIDRGTLVAVPSRPMPPSHGRFAALVAGAMALAAVIGLAILAGAPANSPSEPPDAAHTLAPDPSVASRISEAPVVAVQEPTSIPIELPAEPVAPAPARRRSDRAPREPKVSASVPEGAASGFEPADIRSPPDAGDAPAAARVYVGAAGVLPVSLRLDREAAAGMLIYDAAEGRRELAMFGRVDGDRVQLQSDDAGARVDGTITGDRLLGRCWLSATEAPRQCLLIYR